MNLKNELVKGTAEAQNHICLPWKHCTIRVAEYRFVEDITKYHAGQRTTSPSR